MITVLAVVCAVLIALVAYLLWENHIRGQAILKQWQLLQTFGKRVDILNSLNLKLQQDFEEVQKRLQTTTELSLLNNKFIETVKKTAEDQIASARSRVATIQSRGVR